MWLISEPERRSSSSSSWSPLTGEPERERDSERAGDADLLVRSLLGERDTSESWRSLDRERDRERDRDREGLLDMVLRRGERERERDRVRRLFSSILILRPWRSWPSSFWIAFRISEEVAKSTKPTPRSLR